MIDEYGNPIYVGVYDFTLHDLTIIIIKLDKLYTETPQLF